MLLGWLVSDTLWKDKRQWTKIEIQEIPYKNKKEILLLWRLFSVAHAVSGVSILEILKTQLDTALNNLLYLSLLWATRLDKMISRGAFLPQFCVFSDWPVLLSKWLNWELLQVKYCSVTGDSLVSFFLLKYVHLKHTQWWSSWCI